MCGGLWVEWRRRTPTERDPTFGEWCASAALFPGDVHALLCPQRSTCTMRHVRAASRAQRRQLGGGGGGPWVPRRTVGGAVEWRGYSLWRAVVRGRTRAVRRVLRAAQREGCVSSALLWREACEGGCMVGRRAVDGAQAGVLAALCAAARELDEGDAAHVGSVAWAEWLCEACMRGDARTVRVLVHGGVPARTSTAWHDTPLHVASEYGHASIVSELLAAGADARARDADGRTPLARAARLLHADVLRLLVAAAPDTGDATLALASVVDSFDRECAALLVHRAGADVNGATAQGERILAGVCRRAHSLAAVVWLGVHGARPDLVRDVHVRADHADVLRSAAMRSALATCAWRAHAELQTMRGLTQE